MRTSNLSSLGTFGNTSFVQLHDNNWLDKQRIAGRCVARVMQILLDLVKDRTNLSLIEMDKIVADEIEKDKCSATFFQYKGFPSHCCFSVNKQLVHGVATDYRLKEGDMISFDFGATFEGAIADSATTVSFGEPKNQSHTKLMQATKDALYAGIEAIKVGTQLGCIGSAIYKSTKQNGFNVITHYGGHGISYNMPHAQPFVSNKAEKNEGIRIQPGMSIAIEPMLTSGSTKTYVDNDGWTVWCEAEVSSHEEHTVFIHNDNKVEIITKRNND